MKTFKNAFKLASVIVLTAFVTQAWASLYPLAGKVATIKVSKAASSYSGDVQFPTPPSGTNGPTISTTIFAMDSAGNKIGLEYWYDGTATWVRTIAQDATSNTPLIFNTASRGNQATNGSFNISYSSANGGIGSVSVTGIQGLENAGSLPMSAFKSLTVQMTYGSAVSNCNQLLTAPVQVSNLMLDGVAYSGTPVVTVLNTFTSCGGNILSSVPIAIQQ